MNNKKTHHKQIKGSQFVIATILAILLLVAYGALAFMATLENSKQGWNKYGSHIQRMNETNQCNIGWHGTTQPSQIEISSSNPLFLQPNLLLIHLQTDASPPKAWCLGELISKPVSDGYSVRVIKTKTLDQGVTQ